MEDAHQVARKVLTENRPRLNHLARKLLIREILEGAELEAAFGEPIEESEKALEPEKVLSS